MGCVICFSNEVHCLNWNIKCVVSVKWVKVSLVNLDSSSCFQVHQFCSVCGLVSWRDIPYFHFLLSSAFWNERACYGGKRGKKMWKLLREPCWEGNGCGIEGDSMSTQCRLTAFTSSRWPKTWSFHPRTRSSSSLWWSECQRKNYKLSSFFSFFLVGSNRRAISLCSHWCFSACMDSAASQTTR